MNNKTILLIWVLAIAVGGIIGLSIPEANAHIPEDGTYENIVGSIWKVFHLLTHIYEEEQKQTKLLDQISCYTYYQDSRLNPSADRTKHCVEPLNYTGVWTLP